MLPEWIILNNLMAIDFQSAKKQGIKWKDLLNEDMERLQVGFHRRGLKVGIISLVWKRSMSHLTLFVYFRN